MAQEEYERAERVLKYIILTVATAAFVVMVACWAVLALRS
jgi:hypothetical protein